MKLWSLLDDSKAITERLAKYVLLVPLFHDTC
jgi:hypothetical protein